MEQLELKRFAELKTRVVSAFVLAIAVLATLYMGGLWFSALILLAALFMLREWDALHIEQNNFWRIAGTFYVFIPCLSLLALRSIVEPNNPDMGFHYVLWLLLVVWATDIGAYFAGRSIGGPKIIPSISPSKTWAGLAGGILAAGFMGLLLSRFVSVPPTGSGCLLLGCFIAIISQAGDFFESWLKRRAGVKDSGTLIPGHGGVLDRVDGLVSAAPVYALIVLSYGTATV